MESRVKLNHHLHAAQSHALTREWQSRGASVHSPSDFILPIFVVASDDAVEDIHSLPGVKRFGVTSAIRYLQPLVEDLSLRAVLLFPVLGDNKGISKATDPAANPVLRLIPLLRTRFPNLLIVTDVCLCGFTETGHCCVFDENQKLDNEKSLIELSRLSVAYASAGAHVIAPSDMMDGRVGAIRRSLNENAFADVSIMSYAAKFSSCFYGPFRDAAGSAPQFGDRKCYQLPLGASGLAMRAVSRDIDEGADIVMVKPGLPYLDIVKQVSHKHPDVPVSVYHVSGEYAMLWHGAAAGAFDLKTAVLEVMSSFKRAGAGIIITYFTPSLLQWLKDGQV